VGTVETARLFFKGHVMNRPVLSLPTKDAANLKPKTDRQQGQDFTDEGAPPPGKVLTDIPVDEAKPRHDVVEKAKG
jgi:hypothetical protein